MLTISLFGNCFGCVCMYVVNSALYEQELCLELFWLCMYIDSPALCRPEVCLETVIVVYIR